MDGQQECQLPFDRLDGQHFITSTSLVTLQPDSVAELFGVIKG